MKKLLVSASPHIHSPETTTGVMGDVLISLLPALVMAVVWFGSRALVLTAVCIGTAVLAEWLSRRVMKRPNTLGDLSAVVTGLILALNLPASLPLWMAAIGSVVAIVVVKQMFGGIGQNFVNPALTARIILMNSFPAKMTAWTAPMDHSFSDAMTTATPLGVLSEGTGAALPSYLDMFLGNTGGCLGETCALALILGGIYLVARRVISPVIPVTYLATAAVLSALLGRDPLMDILSGGLLLGAIFMATDYTTSPINFSARVIYAVGCGVLTILIRQFASLPEGVSYSIVLMNILVPLIERVAKPQTFGKMKAKKAGDAK